MSSSWSRQLFNRLKSPARRVIPLAWRRRLNDRLRGVSVRGQLAAEPDLAYTNQLDVFVFAGAGRDASGGCRPAPEMAWQVRGIHTFYPGDPPFAGLLAAGDTPRTVAGCEQAAGWLETFAHTQAVEEAVCVVQHPVWHGVVAALKQRYGWKVVVDSLTVDRATGGTDQLPAPEPDGQPLSSLADLVIREGPVFVDGELQGAAWQDIRNLYERVSIIIVSYNGLEFTRQCVESILGRTIYPNYDIIVVDNGSKTDVEEYLRGLAAGQDRVQVVLNGANRGFAAANNIGLQRAAGSQFVVLLNNDTVVPRGWLCRLLRHARKPQVGLVGPVTNWTGNEARIEVSYRDVRDVEAFARAHTYANEGKAFDIGVLAMYCVAMRKAVADQVGPLDERYEVGMFEDDDYARRVRQAGYRVICAEDVFVHHYGMASFARLGEAEYRAIFERNKERYEQKWGGPWQPYRARDR